MAARILQIERCERYRTEGFILEGGSIHVDGEGTVITTEECLLNKNRNPQMSREAIEDKLRAYLGIHKIIWLPYGLFNDETNGHIDNFCYFIRPGEVLLAWTDDPQDPNFERCQATLQALENVRDERRDGRDAKDRKLIIHKMPIPGPLYATPAECVGVQTVAGTQSRDPGVRLAGSYINFLIVNGGIIAAKFDDPKDAEAEAILKRIFPQHDIVIM